ncbi:MAG TPA: MinD/ParA family protein [Candidatus Avamphibacillus intestinigallinarum]|nr:MinD/ParA family protein [Candidatus Avamphibacillus intestinigallinarum]
MSDQADKLRQQLANKNRVNKAKTIAIVSGKGGVGKSNITVNLALSLKKQHKKVLIFDLDIGMGNIDILLGHQSDHSITELFDSRANKITDLIEQDGNELHYISGGSGLLDIFTMNQTMQAHFFEEFQSLLTIYDYIFFDMGAGASKESLFFIMATDECIVVSTPEPTALTDAYGMIKQIVNNSYEMPIKIIMNRSPSNKIGYKALNGLSDVIQQFLRIKVVALGILPEDRVVSKAVMNQMPYVLYKKEAPVSKAMRDIATTYVIEKDASSEQTKDNRSFIQKLKQFILEG